MRSLVPEVTDGPRATIFSCVSEVPGIHLREIERETKLPLGQVLYHLDRLERMGLVVSARDAGFRRYYPAHDLDRGDKPFLAALRHEVPRRILLAILTTGPRSHKALAQTLGIAGSTLSFHLQRLLASGVLQRERIGSTNIYAIADQATLRRVLIYYRESFRDPAVDRFARHELARLPAAGPEAIPVVAHPS